MFLKQITYTANSHRVATPKPAIEAAIFFPAADSVDRGIPPGGERGNITAKRAQEIRWQ